MAEIIDNTEHFKDTVAELPISIKINNGTATTDLTKEELKIIENCDKLAEEFFKSVKRQLKPLIDNNKLVVYSHFFVTKVAEKNCETLLGRYFYGSSGKNISQLIQTGLIALTTLAQEVKSTTQDLLTLFLEATKHFR